MIIRYSTSKLDITAENCRTRQALLFILGNPETQHMFLRFCKSQHCEENVMVWVAIQGFREAASAAGRLLLAQDIIRKVCLVCAEMIAIGLL